jgi:hypothetical protein
MASCASHSYVSSCAKPLPPVNTSQFFYISLLVFVNVTASYTTNLFPPEQEAAILANPADVEARIFGSKMVIPLEQSMLLTTWLVKSCIWLFLRRLWYFASLIFPSSAIH